MVLVADDCISDILAKGCNTKHNFRERCNLWDSGELRVFALVFRELSSDFPGQFRKTGRWKTMINSSLNIKIQKHLLLLNKVYEKRTNISDEVWDPKSSLVLNFIPRSRAIEELFCFLLHLEFRDTMSTLRVIWQENAIISMFRGVFRALKHFLPNFTGIEQARRQQIRLSEHS